MELRLCSRLRTQRPLPAYSNHEGSPGLGAKILHWVPPGSEMARRASVGHKRGGLQTSSVRCLGPSSQPFVARSGSTLQEESQQSWPGVGSAFAMIAVALMCV